MGKAENAVSQNASEEMAAAPVKREKRFVRLFKRDWQLHLLIAFPVIYMIIFHYWPLYGAQIAFRDYRSKDGIWGSKWVGLKWFKKFINNYQFKNIMVNTLTVSAYSIIVHFSLAVIFALLINTIRNQKFKKSIQTITYIPHFISVVVLISMFNQFFSPICGIYGNAYRLLGGTGYPFDFRGTSSSFRHIYVWTGVWANLGWETIIYTAALSAVSPDLHEAAMIDGASRWKRVWNVDFPTILPTACTMLILKAGSIMSVGFEKTFLLQTDVNRSKSEVISTYVYKAGMSSQSDFSYGSAIGLFNSIIDCTLLVFVNWLSKKLSSDEVGLF